eukprot:gene8358-898_t
MDSQPPWNTQQLMSIPWFHPWVDRHCCNVLLQDNGVPGCYLLRESSRRGDYVVSVRSQFSVQHFEVAFREDSQSYHFGRKNFRTLEEFTEHFKLRPALKSTSGSLVVFQTPYNRVESDCSTTFGEIVKHMEDGARAESKDLNSIRKDATIHKLSYESREGVLKKRGHVVKNIKERWFVVNTTTIAYYKSCRQHHEPIRSLQLHKCVGVIPETDTDEDLYGFGIQFPKRTYFLYCNTRKDRAAWVDFITWAVKKSKCISSKPPKKEAMPEDSNETDDSENSME